MGTTGERLFRIVNILSFWLTLHPYYDMTTKTAFTNKWHKAVVVLKVIILLTIHSVSLIGRIHSFSENSSVIMICLDVVLFFIESFITTLVICMSTFGDIKKWDTILNFVKWKFMNCRYKWKYITVCFFILTFPLILIGIRSWLLTNMLGFKLYRFYISRELGSYFGHLQFMFCLYLVYHVRAGLKDINHSLLKIGKEMKIGVKVISNMTTPANLKFLRAYNIAQLKQSYMYMQELVEAINAIFGLKLLFLMGYVVAAILNLLETSISLFARNKPSHSEVFGSVVVNGIACCGIMVIIMHIFILN